MATTGKNRKLDLDKIRSDFPILSTEMNRKPLVFLDSAASSQKPVQVIEAISNYYKTAHANVHRGVYQLSQQATELFELTRTKVRKFVNAESEREIVFVRGTTEGINLVASCFGRKFIGKGDEIIISAVEHHSNIVPWQLIAEERGATIKIIPVDESGVLDLIEYQKLLTSRVKIVAVNHVSNSLGTINPVKEMIEMAHNAGIPVLVDGAQAVPHMEVDVQELGADFYAFSSHKMYGPTGIGVLYGKEKWLEAIPPYQGGGEMIRSVSYTQTVYNDLPFKFEAGTPNIADAIGLTAAIDYLEDLEISAVGRHEQDLLIYATTLMREISGMKFIGTAPEKAGVISFLIEGAHPYDVGALLDKQGIAVRTGHHCTQPLMDRYGIPGTVRVSFGVYNNFEDIDRLVGGIKRASRMLL